MKAISSFFRPHNVQVQDPPLAKFIFGNTLFAWAWLALRVWLGYQWVDASLHKISSPAWTVTGEALKGYWVNALKTDPKPVIAFDWYRSFIQFMVDSQSYTWFAKVVAYGELAVGIALIVGAFVGIAAFFGAFMNWNFMMAGSASTNPLLFVAAIALVLAWKVAGYYGLDRVLLPMLGTPWKIGYLLNPNEPKLEPQPVKG
jgi:thiosulfate dehydrogenase [quinone] large subunit